MFDFSSLTTAYPPRFPSDILNRLIVDLEKLGAPWGLPSDQQISATLGVDYTARHRKVMLETAKRETARRWIGELLGPPDGAPIVRGKLFSLSQELTIRRISVLGDVDDLASEVECTRVFNREHTAGLTDCFARDVRRQCNEIADMFYGPLPEDHERNSDVVGVIYFLSTHDLSVVKIGFTTNMETRLRSLRTASHIEPTVHLVIEGGPLDEASLHRRFVGDHITREWFRLSAELRAFIETEKVKATGAKPG